MVQNGKFSLAASDLRMSALNKLDLPTFGMPTIPTRTLEDSPFVLEEDVEMVLAVDIFLVMIVLML